MHPHPRRLVLGLLALAALGSVGCSGRACEALEGGALSAGERTPPPRPARCLDVAAGADAGPSPLVLALAAATDGDALCLAPGRHQGPLELTRVVHLWGPRDAIVVGDAGSVITIRAAGTRLEGFTVDGAGGRFDRFDAAVHVLADDVVVEGLTIVHPVYGILVEKARRARVRDNRVEGDRTVAMGLRGDTIRLWETHDSLVEGNEVFDGRDMVVWYSTHNVLRGNRAHGGRYGLHFMYSHDNVVEHSLYRGGVVGVFVMYSKRVTLVGNVIADTRGAGGMGIGLKDSSDVTLTDNLLVRGNVGLYVDQTPSDASATLVVRGNVLRQLEAGVQFHTTPRRVSLHDNDFADNVESFRAASGIDPREARWHDNFYDTYAGYDLDADGRGDMPFEQRSLSEDLVAAHPDLAFFRGSAALGMVDVGSRLLPLAKPRVLVVDPRPRMAARDLAPWAALLSREAAAPERTPSEEGTLAPVDTQGGH